MIDEADFDRVYHAVFGNGEPGMDQQVTELNRAVFKDERTGKPGLVDRIEKIDWKLWGVIVLLVLQSAGVDLQKVTAAVLGVVP